MVARMMRRTCKPCVSRVIRPRLRVVTTGGDTDGMCIRNNMSKFELGKYHCFYGDGMGAGVTDSIRSLFQ